MVNPQRLIPAGTALLAGLLLAAGLLAWSEAGLPPARAATRTITSTADSGPGTLRQALLDAASGDTLVFDPGAFPPGAPSIIQPRSALPTLAQNNVTLDASQAGVILDGALAGANVNGLIIAGDGNTVRGLTIRNFSSNGLILTAGAANNVIGGDRTLGAGPNGQGNRLAGNGYAGLDLRGAGTSGNSVRGNLIGAGAGGATAEPNAQNGIAIWQGASGNTIGGTAAGYRNLISGNGQNGVWIDGAGTDANWVIGNSLGPRADGQGPLGNAFSGVSVTGGAQNTRIGDAAAGAGNLISSNGQNGVYINGAGTLNTRVLGNRIGLNAAGTGPLGQGQNGVVVNGGAGFTVIGDGTPAGRNIIGGNSLNGVLIADAATANTTVQNNYLGTDAAGAAAVPNGQHGLELTYGAHDNQVGGNRWLGLGNLMSGNANHGLVISYGAHHNRVQGNLIGPDAAGLVSLGYQPYGGVDVTEGAAANEIGGLGAGEGNLISGNQMDGIALYSNVVTPTADNQLLGNLIGLTADGLAALPNGGDGIFNVAGTARSLILSNTVAYNVGAGLFISDCTGNSAVQNAFYANGGPAVRGPCLPAPQLTAVTTATVTGTAGANARVQLYADDADEAARYLGAVTADAAGAFTFTQPAGLPGPNVTALYTDTFGNTSPLGPAVHTAWTFLLYLNGDNDLEAALRDMVTQVAAAGASPRANVLALLDGYTASLVYSGTQLFDLTGGALTPVTATLGLTGTLPGELDLGAGQTLADFVTWGRARYPARYTLLSIVDHGGGWAPGAGDVISNTLGQRIKWMAGGSGLSWDFTSDFDNLSLREVQQALSVTTLSGAQPMDVVFFDVCLMGMAEVAYQLKDYAAYFVASQNLGWAPVGPNNRYVRAIQTLPADAAPRDLAGLLVSAYAAATPPNEHPFTIAAVDLGQMPAVAGAVFQLGQALSQTLTGPAAAQSLLDVYTQTQKVDYDGDLALEPATDGFVDLYDLAARLASASPDAAVQAAAGLVTNTLSAAIVAEQHRSGAPWALPASLWNFDGAHGLSIFLPLGEDLELDLAPPPAPAAALAEAGVRLRLRDTYTAQELDFVTVTGWNGLIDRYYTAAAAPIITGTPAGTPPSLQAPDVLAPTSTVTLTVGPGPSLVLTWSAADGQSGVAGANLWRRTANGDWTAAGVWQAGAGGQYSLPLTGLCTPLAIRTQDAAGNLEAASADFAAPCLYLPVIGR